MKGTQGMLLTVNPRNPKPTSMTAQQLIGAGYRCVSRNGGRAARIDRKDWQRVLAREFGCSMAEIRRDGSGSLEDYYRRTLSRDVVLIPEEARRTFPTSGHDPISYVELDAATDLSADCTNQDSAQRDPIASL